MNVSIAPKCRRRKVHGASHKKKMQPSLLSPTHVLVRCTHQSYWNTHQVLTLSCRPNGCACNRPGSCASSISCNRNAWRKTSRTHRHSHPRRSHDATTPARSAQRCKTFSGTSVQRTSCHANCALLSKGDTASFYGSRSGHRSRRRNDYYNGQHTLVDAIEEGDCMRVLITRKKPSLVRF